MTRTFDPIDLVRGAGEPANAAVDRSGTRQLDDPRFEHELKLADVGVHVFVEQDRDAAAKVQRGLRSHFAPCRRYSWQEESRIQFNRWLLQRYRHHAASADDPSVVEPLRDGMTPNRPA